MKNSQQGLIDVIVLVFLIIATVIWLGRTQKADPVELTKLVEAAKSSESATNKIKEFLVVNPTPTTAEFTELKKEVSNIILLDTSKKITGISTLEPKKPTDDELKTAQDAENMVWILVKIIGLFVITVLAHNLYVWYNQRKSYTSK